MDKGEVIFSMEQKPYEVCKLGDVMLVINPYSGEDVMLTMEQYGVFEELVTGMSRGEDTVDLAEKFILMTRNARGYSEAYSKLIS